MPNLLLFNDGEIWRIINTNTITSKTLISFSNGDRLSPLITNSISCQVFIIFIFIEILIFIAWSSFNHLSLRTTVLIVRFKSPNTKMKMNAQLESLLAQIQMTLHALIISDRIHAFLKWSGMWFTPLLLTSRLTWPDCISEQRTVFESWKVLKLKNIHFWEWEKSDIFNTLQIFIKIRPSIQFILIWVAVTKQSSIILSNPLTER